MAKGDVRPTMTIEEYKANPAAAFRLASEFGHCDVIENGAHRITITVPKGYPDPMDYMWIEGPPKETGWFWTRWIDKKGRTGEARIIFVDEGLLAYYAKHGTLILGEWQKVVPPQ